MDFIKKHKKATIICFILLVIFIALFLFLRIFMVDSKKDKYGNRLDGIEKVQISDETISKMTQDINALEEVEKIEYRLQGRLIYLSLEVKAEVSKDTAKEIAAKTLNYFTDEEKAYYDIQIIITSLGENTDYPFIGYKHKTESVFVW